MIRFFSFLSATLLPILTVSGTETILFQPGKDQPLYHRTKTWLKGSDLKPVVRQIKEEDKSFLRFSYQGECGEALSSLKVTKEFVSASDRRLKLAIRYFRDDLPRLTVNCHFKKNNAVMVKVFHLKKGEHIYTVERPWTRGNPPADFQGLNIITLQNGAAQKNLVFDLGKIYTEETQETPKNMVVLKKRRTRRSEAVLPEWGGIFRTQNFYLSGKHDGKSLFMKFETQFGRPPKMEVKPENPADRLWMDDVCEMFFSGENDNRSYRQIVFNGCGKVWAWKQCWDTVAAAVVSRLFKPEMQIQTKVGPTGWSGEICASFDEMGLPPGGRFCGFQFVQNFQGGVPVSFEKSARWVPPENYGILVFNRKPFGPGKAEIIGCTRCEYPGRDKVCFELQVKTDSLPPGVKTQVHITAPDNTLVTRSAELSPRILISDIKNIAGTYTIFLEISNSNGDLLLTAADFENDKKIADRTGSIALIPKPKSLEIGRGYFDLRKNPVIVISENASARTVKTAEMLGARLYGYTGIKFSVVRGKHRAGINLSVVNSGKKEGYSIEVTPEQVRIAGNDEPGLFYGGITLEQILRAPMKRTVRIPVLTVRDWPDLPMRITCHLLQWNFFNRRVVEKLTIEDLMDYVRKYVIESKQNICVLDLSSLTRYRRHPEMNGSQSVYSLSDLKKLADFCRDHFVEFVPRWQIGAHADWWYQAAHPELREPGWRIQGDLSHPEHDNIVFDCILDVVETVRPQYIFIGNDEFWHAPHPKEKPAPRLRDGRTRAQAFLDLHLKITDFCKKHKCRAFIHEDMLSPYHNGHRYNVKDIIDKLPRQSFIIAVWAFPNQNIPYFISKGFTVVYCATGLIPGIRLPAGTQGTGQNIYGYNNITPFKIPSYSLQNMLMADFGWNAAGMPSMKEAIDSGWLPQAHYLRALRPNPVGGTYCSLSGKKNLEIAGIPTALNPKQALDNPIACSGFFSSLVFLHNAKLMDGKKAPVLCRSYHRGEPAGEYTVFYENGSKAVIPIRVQWNISKSDLSQEKAFTLECRAMHREKDASGKMINFYQFEWINPFPEKRIVKVELTQDRRFFYETSCYALSGCRIEK